MLKPISLCLLALGFVTAASHAQSVLVGTGVPAPQAMLEVRSSSKGLLIPRMTTPQRINIPSPPAGLLVYDISSDRLYRHDGTSWRYVLDDDFWKLNGTHVYNLTDSVGINIANPDERMHVSGDVIISTGDLQLNESQGSTSKLFMDYNGLGGDGYLHTMNFYADGTRRGFLQHRTYTDASETRLQLGFVTSMFMLQNNGVAYLNHPSAILQLQSASVDKGFVQLSGFDLRMGVNSANSNGRFVLRTGGSDRFFVNDAGRVGLGAAPSGYKFHVGGNAAVTATLRSLSTISAGNVEINTELQKQSASGTFNMVPAYYGSVAGSTAVCTCSSNSIAVSGIGGGNYFISYPNMSANDIIIVHRNNGYGYATTTYEGGYPRYRILIWDNTFDLSGVENADFSFIVFKQ